MSAARGMAGLSQRELAERAGMSVAAVRDIEQGRTIRPRPAAVGALIDALGLAGKPAEAVRRAAAGGPSAPPGGGHDAPVRIGILGPFTVMRGAHPVPIGRELRRTALARLALSPNSPVPADTLIELLWKTPPKQPAQALHTCVSRLRSALHAGARHRPTVIIRTSAGYRLNLDDEQLDLTEFRRLVRLADTAAPAAALSLLESAAALWRGSLLNDVPSLYYDPLASSVVEERIATVLRLADAALLGGEPARALPALRDLAATDPLHEPIHARLIAVLAAANRQAEALTAFAGIRRRLVDDLGIEPGPDLVAAQRGVLCQEYVVQPGPRLNPGMTAVPAQLPGDLKTFTGRRAATAALDTLLDDPAVTVAIISGQAGVGKTTLAVHWAHRVRERFPDGQLYVNLRGFHPTAEPVTASQASHGFLTALGVPAGQIPADPAAQTALYRTLLADRRILVVLDNARDAEQVRSLVPGTAGCFTLVTSRHQLGGLVATEGACPVSLDLLTTAEARMLLARRLGDARTETEAEAVDALVARCAHLPLALAIVAAKALTRPGATLADLAADLAERDRLDALSVGDAGTDVRAVFACSYRELTAAARRLFRLSSLHPGPDLDTMAAAALIGRPVSDTVAVLAELTGVHLLTELAPGRYTAHDLLQAYAADRAEAETSPAERETARSRLVEHFLITTRAAIARLSPGELDAAPTGDFTGAADARAWLNAERANLLALARQGRPTDTTALAAAAYRYFDGGYYADAYALHSSALAAARDTGDRAAEALAARFLGITCSRRGAYAEATAHLERALALCRELGDQAGEGRSLAELGVTSSRLGDYDRARSYHQAALDIFREIGDQHGEAMQLVMFGIGNRLFGDAAASAADLRGALRMYRKVGHLLGVAEALNNLGLTHQITGGHHEALDDHEQALAIFRELGHRQGEASARNYLGHAFRAVGRPAVAVGHYQAALVMYEEIGERAFEIEAINGLAAAQADLGDLDAARNTYTTALNTAEQTGDRHEQAAAHNGLAALYAAGGATRQAERHRHAAHVILADLGLPAADTSAS